MYIERVRARKVFPFSTNLFNKVLGEFVIERILHKSCRVLICVRTFFEGFEIEGKRERERERENTSGRITKNFKFKMVTQWGALVNFQYEFFVKGGYFIKEHFADSIQ